MQWTTVADNPRDDAELVTAATAGDGSAFAELFDRWFDRAFDVAYRILWDRDLAGDVAQDTFLAAWRNLATLEQPGSFGGWISRIARNRALNRLERKRRSSPVADGEVMDVLHPPEQMDEPAAVVEAAEAEQLVWAAAAALGERDASVLYLHLRHGLGATELADELGVTPNNASQVLFRLRERLGDAIRAWTLWNHGHPRCDRLAADLTARKIKSFDRQTARVVNRHAKGCDVCEADRERRLAPTALFSAVPIALAGPVLRARAAEALAAQGVPVSPGGTGAAGSAGDGAADGGGPSSGPGPSGAPDLAGPATGGASGVEDGATGGAAAPETTVVASGVTTVVAAPEVSPPGGGGHDGPVAATAAGPADAGAPRRRTLALVVVVAAVLVVLGAIVMLTRSSGDDEMSQAVAGHRRPRCSGRRRRRCPGPRQPRRPGSGVDRRRHLENHRRIRPPPSRP